LKCIIKIEIWGVW